MYVWKKLQFWRLQSCFEGEKHECILNEQSAFFTQGDTEELKGNGILNALRGTRWSSWSLLQDVTRAQICSRSSPVSKACLPANVVQKKDPWFTKVSVYKPGCTPAVKRQQRALKNSVALFVSTANVNSELSESWLSACYFPSHNPHPWGNEENAWLSPEEVIKTSTNVLKVQMNGFEFKPVIRCSNVCLRHGCISHGVKASTRSSEGFLLYTF